MRPRFILRPLSSVGLIIRGLAERREARGINPHPLSQDAARRD